MSRASAAGELPGPPLPAVGQGFGAIVGQQRVVTALRSAIERGRLPHALLLTGPPGVGKATVAGILAQAMGCRVSGPSDACGTCASCSRVARGIHPDVLWIAPSPRDIYVTMIAYRADAPIARRVPLERTAIGFIGYRPFEGRRRVVVIDDAHAMNDSAQNALLKALEEPPASTQIILATSLPQRLLPTVRSRCQALRFAPVAPTAVQRHLTEALGIEPAEARLRAALAPGSIGRAIALDLDEYAERLEMVVDALRLALQGPAGIVAAAQALAGSGEGDTATQRATSLSLVARDVLRDLLVVASAADTGTLVNADREAVWRQMAAGLRPEALAEALGALSAGMERFSNPGITPNIKLAFEAILIDVYRALAATADEVPA